MFIVIYSFQVKKGRENDLRKSWTEMTKLIIKYKGALGFRLHQADNNLFIAYAQWPDKATWENKTNLMPKIAKEYSQYMTDCCTKIKTEYTMKVVEDLLVF